MEEIIVKVIIIFGDIIIESYIYNKWWKNWSWRKKWR